MTIQQRNQLAMFLAVKAVCDINGPVWQKSPAFAAAYLDFLARLDNIQRPATVNAGEANGAQKKSETRLMMCQAAVSIAMAISAHAKKTKNKVVADAISFSVAGLMAEPDADCARRCENIHDLAATGFAYLEVHGITEAKLGMLKMGIADFKGAAASPLPAMPGKGMAKKPGDEFDAAEKILGDVLDNLVEQFQFVNFKFVHDYQAVRTIADSLSRQNARKEEIRAAGRAASA